MVLFDGYGPRIVALENSLSFQMVSILFLPFFCFWSVLPKLQASLGRIGEAVQATQRQQSGAICVAATADVIGAVWYPALINKVGNIHPANQKFLRFFFFAALRLFAGPIVLVKHKENERIGKVRKTICSALPIVIEIAE